MVYITGSQGFLGSHLKDRFLDCVRVPHQDIQKTDWSEATKIFFLSTYGNMSHHYDMDKIVKANVSDLIFVLSKLDWSIIESFVFISTSSVKLRYQTTYSRTKKAAEEILMSYMHEYDVPITIIRPMSVTGVGEQPSHLIPKLIDSCINGTEMDFVSEPTHDFIDVDDVVDGIMNLSDNKATGIFELGNGIMVKNSEVLDIVELVTERKANIKKVESMRAYDNEKWVSENFKSRGYGWLPKKTLLQSITEMVDQIKNAS